MTASVIEKIRRQDKCPVVLTTQQLLAELAARNVKRARMAEVLELAPPRITELYKGARQLYHDEAVKLVEAFDLDQPHPKPAPISEPVARLLVLHAMNQLQVPIDTDAVQVQELAQDFRAFSEFAASPSVRENLAALDAFLRGRVSSGSQVRAA